MKLPSFGMVFVSIALLAVLASTAFSQQQFKVGDKVEIIDLGHNWAPGTVIGVLNDGSLYYRVKLDDENASTVYFNHVVPASIRSRGAALPNGNGNGNGNNTPNGNGNNTPAAATATEGELVDVYYNARDGWNRGRMISANGNNVKVRFIGCERDETVDKSQIHVPATIAATAPPISFLFARWTLTKVGTSSYNTAWGKAEGIQVNNDGTYIWYQERGKQPVKGTWVTDAKVPNTDSGTQFYDGILVKDSTGRPWKVFKWSVKGYPDGIQVQRMCSGETIVGSRAR